MRAKTILIAGLIAGVAATPAAAQQQGSAGNGFITAVRDNDGGKAVGLLKTNGSTVINYRNDAGEGALH